MTTLALRTGKRERQQAILELVRVRSIHTQEELVAALHRLHVDATQATVSRDVRELGLVRIHDPHGPRYAAVAGGRSDAGVPLRRAVHDHVRSIEFVEHLGVLRTFPACAPVVAGALDQARLDEVAGTVAGDDTVLVVTRSRAAARRLQEQLDEMVGGG